MECISPITLKNPKDGNPMVVPCSRCYACLSRRRDSWTFRLKQELRIATSAHFITLTYSDEHLPRSDLGWPMVSKTDIQLFLKRLRKKISPNKIRYFLVSEYGDNTQRPHYHYIMFNFPLDMDIHSTLLASWQQGHVGVGTVTDASIHYVSKYCMAFTDLPDYLEKPFMLCSRKPAIGANYLTDNKIEYHKKGEIPYVVNNGHKMSMPRYYRDKIFDEKAKKRIQRKQYRSLEEKKEFYQKLYGQRDLELAKAGHPSTRTTQVESFINKLKRDANSRKKNKL